MKKIFLFFLLAFALVAQNADAQSKKVTKKKTTSSSKSKSKDKKDEGEVNFWTEKMMYGGFINYPAFGRGIFNMSLSPMIGYKLHKNIAAGLITSVNYTWARNTVFAQPPINLVDLGIGIFARAKFFDVVLLHADYQRTNYKIPTDLSTTPITVVNYPLTSAKIGIGYLQGFSKWKYEVGIYYDALFDVNKSLRDNPFEYRAALTYNF
jgi:hypothetical protein